MADDSVDQDETLRQLGIRIRPQSVSAAGNTIFLMSRLPPGAERSYLVPFEHRGAVVDLRVHIARRYWFDQRSRIGRRWIERKSARPQIEV